MANYNAVNFLFVNTNHARAAQDLAFATMRDRRVSIMVLAEPFAVPISTTRWIVDSTRTVAITWDSSLCPLPCTPLPGIFQNFVALQVGPLTIYGVYASPNNTLFDYC